MVTAYGEDCVSDMSVRKWSARFRAGRESLVDDPRPGQANTVIAADLIDKVDDLYHENPSFLERIIAGDESWCHHYEPETKWDSIQWKHTSSPSPKKFKAVSSAGKITQTPDTTHDGQSFWTIFKAHGDTMSATNGFGDGSVSKPIRSQLKKPSSLWSRNRPDVVDVRNFSDNALQRY
ncbi:hypothetical protein HNY73_004899 [Argiope bruennichi]|uniref:Mos1 transposase HTH domain-containing protein n=1 Tax=Argiope bruennichi TaxID=94029 RepID=A0A8T0FQF7_ARGBR|nr:hypothetical protein HNY73_004899 [Argiope bruennichi]